MQPLSYDIRSYYRKHQSGETVTDSGEVIPTFTTDGPYQLAFRSGGESRTLGETGYTSESEIYFVIADGVTVFKAGDILTDGTTDLYRCAVVKNWPTEQTMYVRAI